MVNGLIVKSLGIDTYRENIIFMNAECRICKSEGFSALTRVLVEFKNKRIIATLNVVNSELLELDEAGLSIEAMKRLGVNGGETIHVFHLKPIESLSKVRSKMYGNELKDSDFSEIIADVVAGQYSNIELAAFISACSGDNLTITEIIGLTRAMVENSEKMKWSREMVLDKHCVGGLPGNRTTPIVVSIAAAAGLTIPKTSSRAITSPAGTADVMATLTTVNLTAEQMKETVESEGGCLVWGAGVKLSPADDILISVERALDVDSEGQMIASVMSKKIAAGSTHVVIEIPVGPTAKVRSMEAALKLKYYFKAVAAAFDIFIEIVISDGSQPVGIGIGPVLEAIDIISILQNEIHAPQDLKKHAIEIAGLLLEMSGKYSPGTGQEVALEILQSGEAYKKFVAICKKQGGFRELHLAPFRHDILSTHSGIITAVDCRKISRIAKLAGAPRSPGAGIRFYANIGKQIQTGDVLYSVYSDSQGEMEYVKEYLGSINGVITME
ncbi:MAG: thymidine phosphorylase family protein [Bacteroidetes bacterium]|nr:thymidine phosphorylase family protein [Bacteroidota bacterium]